MLHFSSVLLEVGKDRIILRALQVRSRSPSTLTWQHWAVSRAEEHTLRFARGEAAAAAAKARVRICWNCMVIGTNGGSVLDVWELVGDAECNWSEWMMRRRQQLEGTSWSYLSSRPTLS